MNWIINQKKSRQTKIKDLKKALERVAFASLIADIAISAVTVVSLKVGQSYTVGIIFILNYILTAIVAVALILMGYIFVLTNKDRFSRILSFFRFGS